jgi:hypothetical protein
MISLSTSNPLSSPHPTLSFSAIQLISAQTVEFLGFMYALVTLCGSVDEESGLDGGLGAGARQRVESVEGR